MFQEPIQPPITGAPAFLLLHTILQGCCKWHAHRWAQLLECSTRLFLGCLQETDQGIYNFNPNFIRVPTGNINLVPTDLRGLTFSRTPQQVWGCAG